MIRKKISKPKTPQDNISYRYPVSIKGVVCQGDKVILLKNDREEWELPGGKLELGESPENCIVREIAEELGLTVRIGSLLDTWVYHISPEVVVFIVTYGCYPEPFTKITPSSEHTDFGFFSILEIEDLKMPINYKKSIYNWVSLLEKSKKR